MIVILMFVFGSLSGGGGFALGVLHTAATCFGLYPGHLQELQVWSRGTAHETSPNIRYQFGTWEPSEFA